MTWTAAGDDEWLNNINNGKYKIDYATWTKTWTSDEWQVYFDTSCISQTPQSYTVSDLAPNTTYYFRIWTRDEIAINWSELSNGTTQLTLCNLPNTPDIVELQTSSAAIKINENSNPYWTTYSIKVASTEVKYLDGGGNLVGAPIYQTTTSWTSNIWVKGLMVNTTYVFSVDAKNAKGITTEYSSGEARLRCVIYPMFQIY